MNFKKLLILAITLIGIISLASCGVDEPLEVEAPTLSLSDYEGKSFIDDGIGIVEMVSCEDGDTAEFLTDGQVVRLRFLGVDTPEASHYYEAWGVAATNFACNLIENADTVVLEWDEAAGTRLDNYGRHLGFVWADGVNVNYELILHGYSTAQGVSLYKYGEAMTQAEREAREAGLRLHGETDPDFPYTGRGDGQEVTIEQLNANIDDYLLDRVTISGTVSRILGDQAFMQADGHGIFIYAGHGRQANDRLAVGNQVTITDAQVYRDVRRYGGNFLTDVPNALSNSQKIASISVNDTDQAIEPILMNWTNVTRDNIHTLVEVQSLTIVDIYTQLSSENNPSNILLVEDAEGKQFEIVQSYRVYNTMRYDFSLFEEGMEISLIGIFVEDETNTFKLLLLDKDDVTIVNP